jgi:sulfide:quinone oxidoreductase
VIMNTVIAGGGVAGLEALLGLRKIAGNRVGITLIAPDPDFSYRPMAVAEPFALGRAHRVPLRDLAEAAGAELVGRGSRRSTTPRARYVWTTVARLRSTA